MSFDYLTLFNVKRNVFTNPLAFIKQIPNKAFEGNTRTFLNLGYQKQIGKLYLGILMGVSVFEKDFTIYDKGRKIQRLHGGALIGYIFDKRKSE